VLVDSLVAVEALDETTKTNEQHDCNDKNVQTLSFKL
jgi:hypothetical protein